MKRTWQAFLIAILCIAGESAPAQSFESDSAHGGYFGLDTDMWSDVTNAVSHCGSTVLPWLGQAIGDVGRCLLDPLDTSGGCAFSAAYEQTYLQVGGVESAGLLFDNGAAVGGVASEAGGTFVPAPRFWMGIENCRGVGYRVRYWQFHDDDGAEGTVPGAATFVADRVFHASTLDVEMTKRFSDNLDHCVLASLGFRYAAFENSESLGVVGIGPTFGDLSSGTEYKGYGGTLAVQSQWPLFDTALSFAWSARGSVLIGPHTASANSSLIVGGITGLQIVDGAELTIETIAELQVGLKWNTCPNDYGISFFASAMFEFQYWNLHRDDDFDFNQSIGSVLVAGNSLPSDWTFFGATFAIGFSR